MLVTTTDDPVRLQGGCFCGRIRYRLEAPTTDPTICHCTDCRRSVGAHAVAWFSVPVAAFEITRGDLRTFASSHGVVRGFCAACGTSLTYRRTDTEMVDVTTASLDEPDRVPPRDHTWTREQAAWDQRCDGLPEFSGVRPADA